MHDTLISSLYCDVNTGFFSVLYHRLLLLGSVAVL